MLHGVAQVDEANEQREEKGIVNYPSTAERCR